MPILQAIQLRISMATQAAVSQLQALAARISATFNSLRISNPVQQVQGGMQALSTSLIAVRSLYVLAAGEAARFFYNLAKGANDAAKSYQALALSAKAAGASIAEASDAASRLAADGRITKAEASEAIATLVTAGAKDIAVIERYIETLKNFAGIFGNPNMSLGYTVTSVATAIKTGNSGTLDNSGIPTNASVYLEQYARSIGTAAGNLTQAEQAAALMNGTLTDMNRLLGDAPPALTRFSSATGALTTSWDNFTKTIGRATEPLTSTLIEGMSVVLNWASQATNAIMRLGSSFVGLFRKSKEAVAEAKGGMPQPGANPNAATAAVPAAAPGVPPQIRLGPDGKPVGPLPPIPAASKATPTLPPAGQLPGETLGDYQIRKKRESEALDQRKKVYDALGTARVKSSQSALAQESATIQDALAKRKINGVKAVQEQGRLESQAKIAEFNDLQRKLDAVNAQLEQNQDGKGNPFDVNRNADLLAQKAQLLSDFKSVGEDIQTGLIQNATAVYQAEVELAQESADVRSAKLQEAIDVGQTAFQASLDLERAQLEQSLEQQLVSQREYIEKTKQMRLAEIAEQDRQTKIRLQDAKNQLAIPGLDPVRRAQLASEIAKLNADIAASTQRRAAAEAEALTKVLQLEEQIKQARASLVQQEATLLGQSYEAQLESIKENVRQFNKQFAGDDEQSRAIRAQRARLADLESAKAGFDEKKRLLDEANAFEAVEIDGIIRLRSTGAMTERQAEKAIQEERLKTIAITEDNVKAMEALALASGNQEWILAAKQAREAFESLRLGALDPLATAINRTFSDSLSQRIQDLIGRTLSWKDALRSIFADVFGNLAQRKLKEFTDQVFNTLEDASNPKSKQGFGGILAGFFDGDGGLSGLLSKLMSSLSSGLTSLISNLGSMLNGMGGGGGMGGLLGGIGTMLGFAEGGPVWGAGTGKSDSIFARLSNGEFVMTARAHQKWGTGFLESLNAGLMPQFAMPAFAQGGPVSDLFTGRGAPSVTVQNNNSARLYLDLAEVATEIGRTPQFGRDVVKVSLANKGKLGIR